MTHTALVDGVLFWLVVAMALLLVMFIYAVVTAPPQGAAPAEPPALEWPAPELPAPAPALPAGWPLAPASPAGAAGLSGDAGYAARHAPAAAPVNPPAKASSGPRWGPAGASILAVAGLATAVTGARMFIGPGQAAMACSHHAIAVCLDGFVLLSATQLAGGVIALAGIGLIVTAIVVALRLAADLPSSAVRLVRAAPISPGPRSRTLSSPSDANPSSVTHRARAAAGTRPTGSPAPGSAR
jgi:hypothetical protein